MKLYLQCYYDYYIFLFQPLHFDIHFARFSASKSNVAAQSLLIFSALRANIVPAVTMRATGGTVHSGAHTRATENELNCAELRLGLGRDGITRGVSIDSIGGSGSGDNNPTIDAGGTGHEPREKNWNRFISLNISCSVVIWTRAIVALHAHVETRSESPVTALGWSAVWS